MPSLSEHPIQRFAPPCRFAETMKPFLPKGQGKRVVGNLDLAPFGGKMAEGQKGGAASREIIRFFRPSAPPFSHRGQGKEGGGKALGLKEEIRFYCEGSHRREKPTLSLPACRPERQ